MSIPLDRLYHYIESIAKEIHGDSIVIYRFYPHGSKILKDLLPLSPHSWVQLLTSPQIICNDQEPLNYEWYQNMSKPMDSVRLLLKKYSIELPDINLRKFINIYDYCILLHSEQRSSNLKKYQDNKFISAYYWNHALLSLDWFRYAKHVRPIKQVQKQFLIYNRAWSGSREYRLKFLENLVKANIIDHCKTSINPVEPELEIHYSKHEFINPIWKPSIVIEDFFSTSSAPSYYSADFDIADYKATDIEIILETLFDDDRLHLTEKSLRPIACAQPFILAGTQGSLEYLQSYGFKTFGHIWDECYDQETNPESRLITITNLMKKIAAWDLETRTNKMAQAQEIADYNKQHFFSKEFFNQITSELKNNLVTALDQIHSINTSKRYIDLRKQYGTNVELRQHITQADSVKSRQDVVKVLSKARKYYLRSL